jgi:hypothetical protein
MTMTMTMTTLMTNTPTSVTPSSVASAYALRGAFRTPRSVALFPAEVLNELYAVLGKVRDLLSLLAVATQALVVAAVLMALLVGFLARRRQFAVLRAIGASRAYVFSAIWRSRWRARSVFRLLPDLQRHLGAALRMSKMSAPGSRRSAALIAAANSASR